MGDQVEVDCGGKGVWYRCKVIKVTNINEYQVKFESDDIKWVSNKIIDNQRNGENKHVSHCSVI